MNNYTIELNSIHKDDYFSGNRIKPESPIVEIFSALAEGKDTSKYGKNTDKAVNFIKKLAKESECGNPYAVSELNTIRRYAIEPKLMEEIRLISLFGSYENIAYGDTIEREVYSHEGEKSRIQASGGDVVFPFVSSSKYNVSTVTVAGGYAVDYRKLQLGDMTRENEGMNQVRIDIRNRAVHYIITNIYNAVKNVSGIKYFSEASGITKTALDDMLTKVRRFGKPNIFGDYSVVSQINNIVPYDNGTVRNISDTAMEEIRKNTFIRTYGGSAVMEIPNAYDLTSKTADGANFRTFLPEGLLFIIPSGVASPVKTWSRGGLTSMTGNDVTTGKILTRFDLEIACDVAKGHEFEIGMISDTNFEI